MPIEVNVDFLAHLRQSFSLKYGATWEIKAEYLSNVVNIKDCQHISKEFSLEYDPNDISKGNEKDDDEFDEEDDDEDQT